jgi:uncharacterized Fe-S center protein
MPDVFLYRFKSNDSHEREAGFLKLIERTGINFIRPGDNVALKVHFGEAGCTTFVKPSFSKKMVDYVLSLGGHPFLTDSNALYSGRRKNGSDHRKLAIEHGFGGLGADIVIADGENSELTVNEQIGLKHFKSIKYGKAVADADSLLVVSHFKGHMLCGFGGAIKNVGMGLGSRAAKQMMHADVKPQLQRKQDCEGCGKCAEVCPAGAVSIEGDVPVFDESKCEGCAECIAACPKGALKIQWDGAPEKVMEKIAETCFAVLKSKANKALYYNFVMDVTPDCDCMGPSGTPLIEDVGILASSDPVAIDAASLYLVTQAKARKDSKIGKEGLEGSDKFRLIRPSINGEHIFNYGEKINLGKRDFSIIEI